MSVIIADFIQKSIKKNKNKTKKTKRQRQDLANLYRVSNLLIPSVSIMSELVPRVQQTRWNGSEDHVQVDVGVFIWLLYINNLP